MVLDRYPDNFFAETEQVAFCPRTSCPASTSRNDPLLQGRLFSYLDTQLSRLGRPNFHQLPVNAPKCPFANHQRDGHMQMQVPKGRVNYEPSSLAGRLAARDAASGFRSVRAPARSARARPHPLRDLRRPLQPGAAVLPQPDRDRAGAHGVGAGVRAVEGRDARTSARRWSATCSTSTADLGRRVADGLALDELPPPPAPAAPIIDMAPSPALQLIGKMKDTLEGRCGRDPGRRRLRWRRSSRR